MPVTSVPEEVLEGFRHVATASISDALDKAGCPGFMDPAIKPIFPVKLVGPAVTVLELVSNEPPAPPVDAIQAIDMAAPGSVIVIGTEGEGRVAVWGGLMTACASLRGLAGAVLDGGVRDADEIRRDFQFPVFSRSIVPSTSVGRMTTRGLNTPITCGGVDVRPGDIIVGDGDGVVAIPSDKAVDVLKAAEAIEERERRMVADLKRTRSLSKTFETFARI